MFETSARTSAARRSPTKWSGPTSPSSGSASIRQWTTRQRSRRIQSIVDGYPGLYRDLLTYLRERIKEVLTGASATIVVRVYGPDLERLQAQAQAVRAAIADVEGVADLTVQAQVLVPKVEVRFDPERAAAFGLTPGEVRRAAATLVQGTKVGEFYEDQQLFDVVVWGRRKSAGISTRFAPCRCPSRTGAWCRSAASRSVEVTPTPNEITRENGSRRIDVTSNVRGRDLGAVARDIQARLAGMSFPQGYYAEVLGEYAERQASSTRLTLLGVIAVAAIFLILLADFGSARVATLVFLTLPFALVGAIVAAFLTGGVLSLGSLVGLVTVIGISARNGIMLISHYRHLELQEGMAFGRELVLRGVRGAARADPHDGAGDRSCARADRARRHARRLRDRASAGRRHPGRAVHVDAAQPLHRAGAVPEIRTLGLDDSGRNALASRLNNSLPAGQRSNGRGQGTNSQPNRCYAL